MSTPPGFPRIPDPPRMPPPTTPYVPDVPKFQPTPHWRRPKSGPSRGGLVWRLIKGLFTIAFLAFVIYVAYLLMTSGSEPLILPDLESGH